MNNTQETDESRPLRLELNDLHDDTGWEEPAPAPIDDGFTPPECSFWGAFIPFVSSRENIEGMYAKAKPKASSYLSLRVPVQRAVGGLLEALLHRFVHVLSGEPRIAELGCGPDAFFWSIAPEEYRPRWCLYDLNPTIVKTVIKRHPGARVAEHSFHKPLDEQVDAILCFNSLDSTPYLEDALSAMRDSLAPGGTIIAYQDVLPSNIAVLGREHLAYNNRPEATQKGTAVLNLQKNGRNMNSKAYLTKEIYIAGIKIGLLPHLIGFLQSEYTGPREAYHPEGYNTFDPHNYKRSHRTSQDPAIPEGMVVEKARAHVVVLYKPG